MASGIQSSYLSIWQNDIYWILTFVWISARRVLVDIKIFTNICKDQRVKLFFIQKDALL